MRLCDLCTKKSCRIFEGLKFTYMNMAKLVLQILGEFEASRRLRRIRDAGSSGLALPHLGVRRG